jgi:hypothetical protein
MQDGIHRLRLTHWRRVGLLAVVTLVSAVLASGCGGGSSGPTAATVGDATTSASSTRSQGPPPAARSDALAFAKCMRASGVPNFPDPASGGGFLFRLIAGINPSSPAVKAAEAKCRRFQPGAPGASVGPAFSEQALVQIRKIAVCMRAHGISDFPDPTTTPPHFSAGDYREITDYRGVFVAFPATLDMQSPAYQQAAAACGATFLGRPH